MTQAVSEYKSVIDTKGSVGVFDSDYTKGLDITKVSHKITDVYIENGGVFCEIEVLHTPAGNSLSILIDMLRAIPCGVGQTTDDYEVTEYRFVTVAFTTKDVLPDDVFVFDVLNSDG